MHLVNEQLYSQELLPDMSSVNKAVVEAFQAMTTDQYQRQTHYFHGRYENIYLNESQIPALKTLISKIRKEIATKLQTDSGQIKMGFWLNVMMPGQMTTRHCHDDLDEVLSGVYYVKVPKKSGNLVLYGEQVIEIEPKESMLVFFSPALEHEVMVNNSDQMRLSIGFNACLLGNQDHA